MKISKRTIACCVFLFASSVTMLGHAGCFRHIYNQSSHSWTFEFINYHNDGVKYIATSCKTNTECTLNGGQTVEIYFPDYAQGIVRIIDDKGVHRDFVYDHHYCAFIHHSGKTGSVSMNDPANGDIKVNKAREHW